MTFTNEISITDITSIISIILVIIGGVFGYYQWLKNMKLRRAGYINELTEKIRTDEMIRDVVYLFDYVKEWYSGEFHDSGEQELKVDKTLSYFSYICYLKRQKIITDVEFDFFRYEVERILTNKQVQDYFYNLYHFSDRFNTPFTFKYLFEYGNDRKLFDEDFFDKESYKTNDKYHKYLIF